MLKRVLVPKNMVHLLCLLFFCFLVLVSYFFPSNYFRLTSEDLESWISKQHLTAPHSDKALLANSGHISGQSLSGIWKRGTSPVTLKIIPSKSGKAGEYKVLFTIHFPNHQTSISRVATLNAGVVKFNECIGDPISETIYDKMSVMDLDGKVYLVPHVALLSNVDSEDVSDLAEQHCFNRISPKN
jgi:hypothetical protein